ncbi:MAG: citrate transporter [Clostridia bacterium]|nr:citrate transporter [Clostridia bacterium]
MECCKTAVLRPVADFIKKNTVMVVALGAAVITSFIVRPDAQYLTYFDLRTLTCLFCVLAIVGALRDIDFFYMLARRIVKCFRSTRLCILALVYITFIGSMLIANDMALLTFLPLGYFVLTAAHREKYMAFTFVMQNIAANLGGMLTPFGNPQNLYLYSKFDIPTGEFVRIMAPPFAVAVLLITVCCMFVKSDPVAVPDEPVRLDAKRTGVYLAAFALAIAIVFRGVPYWIGLVVIPAVLLVYDRKALKTVDYPLLLTFVFFFIFAGNMSRIPAVSRLFSGLLSRNTLVFSVISCQFISNVPSSILLSQFTSNYPALLVGVNIGGTGTLIASLASLITFREYCRHNPTRKLYYLGVFSAFNFGFLAVLTVFMLIKNAG